MFLPYLCYFYIELGLVLSSLHLFLFFSNFVKQYFSSFFCRTTKLLSSYLIDFPLFLLLLYPGCTFLIVFFMFSFNILSMIFVKAIPDMLVNVIPLQLEHTFASSFWYNVHIILSFQSLCIIYFQ